MIVALLLSLSQAGNLPTLPDVNPFALTQSMRHYLDKNIDHAEDGVQQLRTLVHLVFQENALHFTYQPVTRTAIETFENHGGNCVSFTFLLIGMARYLGLDARLREVDIAPLWSEVGDITAISGHDDVVVFIGGQEYLVDLFPEVHRIQLAGRIVSDARAVAHYWNNRGVEQLNGGHTRESLACFQKALQSDPTTAFVWANLGVAETVMGDYEEAVRDHLKALQLDKKELVAMSDLASLFRSIGRYRDAERYEAKVRKFNQGNPYYHFNLGLQAYQSGDYAQSIEQLRAALKLKPTEHNFYLAMARDYFRLGDLGNAVKSLKLALKNAPDDSWRVRYNEKLKWLAARLSSPAGS